MYTASARSAPGIAMWTWNAHTSWRQAIGPYSRIVWSYASSRFSSPVPELNGCTAAAPSRIIPLVQRPRCERARASSAAASGTVSLGVVTISI